MNNVKELNGLYERARQMFSSSPLEEIEPMTSSTRESGLLDAQAAFERVLAKLKIQVGAEAYSSWFGRVQLQAYTGSLVQLSVPTAFLRSWITNHYGFLLLKLWKEERPSVLHVEIVVRRLDRPASKGTQILSGGRFGKDTGERDPLEEKSKEGSLQMAPSGTTGILGSPLDERYTFDSFIEGASNRMAFAAARSVADFDKGVAKFNPLFVHAAVGLGKTHLLQAIAWAVLKNSPQARVVYLTAEYFMWRFATAIRDNDALSFKEQLRDIDLLIIDDMQFLQGKSIQHEFCHLLNLLLNSAKQVVIAADRPPSELESLDARVRSRLQGGVSLSIEQPDYEMRLSMLRHRLALAQVENPSLHIPEEILVYIAKNISGSCRDIDGAFNQILFRQSFENTLSVAYVDEILGHLIRSSETKRIRVEEIQRLVAKYYSVSKQDMLSTRRTRVIVKPRQVAMYLAKTLTPRSLPEIGRRFGGRDHTTVLHAVRKIEDMAEADSKLAQELELLKRLVHEQSV